MLDKIINASEGLIGHIVKTTKKINWESLTEIIDILPTKGNIYVTGAGRSGLVARSFGMRLMHAGLRTYIPGETITPAAAENDLLFAISCTGETGYTSYLASRAKGLGAYVIAITAESQSPIALIADKIISIPAKDEDIVLRAAVFEHTTSLCLDALFNVLSVQLKIDAEAFRKRHANLE